MDAFSIRTARPEDAPLLARAEREIARVPGRLASRPDELVDDAFREKIAALERGDRGVYLVAERAEHAARGGEIVGHALLEPRPLASMAHVVALTIAVHEGWQRKGIGRMLMNELFAWARATPHVAKIELNVRSSNAPAIALYRALGFVEEGRMTRRIEIAPDAYLDDVYMAAWVG